MNSQLRTFIQNQKIRLDKWLWAARFYKTRALARKMIEGGRCVTIVSGPNPENL